MEQQQVDHQKGRKGVYTLDTLLFLPFYSDQSWREKRCEHGKIYDFMKWSLYFKTHYKDEKKLYT
jgi:hypothetical protein